MNRLTGWVVIFLTAGFSGCMIGENGFKLLFNGTDLTGWHAEGGQIGCWTVKDEILSCIAPGGGELTTDSVYSDFILVAEWRIFAGGNSGIGLRFPSDTHVSETGMEIQILDDEAEIHRNIKPAQHTGSIYLQVPARQGAARPVGQWNRYKITCKGPLVLVELNGREIVRADLDRCTVGEGGLTPLAQRPRSGHLGLQSHNTRVDFRNIKIKKL